MIIFEQLFALFLLLLTAGEVFADAEVESDHTIGLRCHGSYEETYYELNSSDGSVLIVSTVPSREGRLTVTKRAYELSFPRDSKYWQMRVIINRVSGKYNREFGEAPFFQDSLGNVSSRGVCERASLQPKL